MKQTLSFGLVLLLLAPFSVFAETAAPYARYCPDPAKDFFNGSIYYENGKPWIKTIVDPKFEQDILRGERKITGDIPLTPVYDLVVRIKPEFNYYCIPGWVEGAPVTAEKLPPFLHVTASIVVGVAADERVVSPVVFSRTEERDEQGRFTYESKMKGWDKGIASEGKMERLIDEISKGKWLANQGIDVSSVNVLIDIPDATQGSQKIKYPVFFDLCAPIWGNGKYKVVGMRGTPKLAPGRMVGYFETVRKEQFATYEPYASNQNYFSFAVDLALHSTDNSFIENLLKTLKEKKAYYFSTQTYHELIGAYFKNTSCPNGLYLQTTDAQIAPLGFDALATYGDWPIKGSLVNYGVNSGLYLHEFSHLFAGLNDEYVSHRENTFPGMNLPLRNCSTNPLADFSFNGKMYGSNKYEGCTYLWRGGRGSAPEQKYYRPSSISKMNLGDTGGFNVVSCGWIIAAIKGGDAKSYFPECAKMDGIIKDGVQASAFYPFFAWLNNTLSRSSANPQTAAVGDSGNSSSNKSYLIIESFDPNNPWGEIIEVVPDSQAVPISPTPSVLPPPPNISDISDDSIFDTLSVDLKVNGQDGPITVEKRDRIVLSWISEGATRCRGVWSKKDLKLSGTAAGRITRSVTIKIACINTDGERADDSVRVNIPW